MEAPVKAMLMAVQAMLVFALPGVVILNGVDEGVKAVMVLLMGTANVGLSVYLAEAYGIAMRAIFMPEPEDDVAGRIIRRHNDTHDL